MAGLDNSIRQESIRHERTRAAHMTETAEDYVEAIADTIALSGECRVTDLSRRFGVTHVTVIKILGRLERDGLVRTESRSPVKLTRKGSALAKKCRERHETVFQFLLAIGVSEKAASVDAEGIEHHVSRETLARFRRFLKHK